MNYIQLQLLTWITLIAIQPGSCRNLYVSHTGQDKSGCGIKPSSPCATIQYMVAHSHNYDIIYIDGSKGPYLNEGRKNHTLISHSLTLVSLPGSHSVIDCRNNGELYRLFKILSQALNGKYNVSFALKNLTIQNCVGNKSNIVDGVIEVNNAEIKVTNCIFGNNGMLFYQTTTPMHLCNKVRLYVSDSDFITNQHTSPFQPGIMMSGCNVTDVTLHYSMFILTPVSLQADKSLHLSAQGLTLSGKASQGSLIDVTLADETNEIIFTDCNVGNFSSAGASSIMIRANQETTTSPNIHMTNVSFINSHVKGLTPYGGALSLMAGFPTKQPLLMNIQLDQCYFSTNFATHSGGAIYLYNVDNVKFTSCKFEDNQAIYGGAIYMQQIGNLSITNSHFEGNMAHPKQNHQELTSGGALLIQGGLVLINNSTFISNLAMYKGSAIYAKQPEYLSIMMSYFEGQESKLSENYSKSQVHAHSATPFTSANIQIMHNSFNCSKVQSVLGNTVLDVSGGIVLKENFFTCPTGHDFLQWVNEPDNNDPFQLSDYVSSCHPCPAGTYALDAGDFNQTSGKHTALKCQPCPSGGECENGILTAYPGFWGYVKNDGKTVDFTSCPKNFCCEKSPCESYKACSNGRKGLVCSECMEDSTFSIAPNSVNCIQNNKCYSSVWMVVLMIICPVLYIFFFTFMPGVEFAFSQFNYLINNNKMVTLEKNRNTVNVHDPDETTPMQISNNDPIPSYGSTRAASTSPDTRDRNNTHAEDQEDQPLIPQPVKYFPDETITITCLLKIWFYFYQILPQVYTMHGPTFKYAHEFTGTVVNIFYLQPIYSVMQYLCFRLSAWYSGKLLFLLMCNVLPMVFAIIFFSVLYFVAIIRSSRHPQHQNAWFNSQNVLYFFCGLYGFLILFTYTPILQATLDLLVCSELESSRILYLDASTSCYQPWQNALWAYFAICLISQFLVLQTGMNLLTAYRISLVHFILSTLFPTPFLILWVVKYKRECFINVTYTDFGVNLHIRHLLHVFQSTYRLSVEKEHIQSYQFWDSVTSFQRLLLIIVASFLLPFPFTRACVLFLVCILVVIYQSIHRPFKYDLANTLGMIHLSLLTILSGASILTASNFHAPTTNKSLQILISICDWIFSLTFLQIPVILLLMLIILCYQVLKRLILACCRRHT